MSIGEVFSRALMDTLMGMGTVFLILIVISFIIWAFKFIPKDKKEIRPQDRVREAEKTAAGMTATVAEEPLEDEDEIIAVILAAIRMSKEREALMVSPSGEAMGEPSYIVRSVKRRR